MKHENHIEIVGRVGHSAYETLNGIEYEHFSVVTETEGESIERDEHGIERYLPTLYVTWFDCLRRRAGEQFKAGQTVRVTGFVLGYKSRGAMRYAICSDKAEVVK